MGLFYGLSYGFIYGLIGGIFSGALFGSVMALIMLRQQKKRQPPSFNNGLNTNLQDAINAATITGPQNKNEIYGTMTESLRTRIITVSRKKAFFGCGVKVNIHIDGNVVASFKNGQSEGFAVDSRKHTLFAAMKVTSGDSISNVINIDASENDARFFLMLKPGGIDTILILTPEE